MKLKNEQTNEILKIMDRVERQTEDFILTLQRARRAIEMEDLDTAQKLLLTAYEQKERSTLLCRALPLYSPEPFTREKVTKALTDAVCTKCGYTEEGWFCAVIPTLLPKKKKRSTDYIKEIIYASLERFFYGKAYAKIWNLHDRISARIQQKQSKKSMARPRQYRDQGSHRCYRSVRDGG